MKVVAVFAMFSVMCFGGAANARDAAELTTTNLHVIVAQQHDLRGLVQDGIGRFGDMPSAERQELLKRQSELLVLLEGKDTVEDLPTDERIVAFNTLEWIEATVNNQPASEIVVCQRRRRTGSHLRKVDCMTEEEARRMRETADNFFNAAGIGNNFPKNGSF